MTSTKNSVLVAVIGAAHGIKGEVRIKTYTADPLALADYNPLRSKDGRAFEVLAVRPQGTVVVARLKGVSDRNQAEALNGVELFAAREALPEEDEGEFFHDDLIGLAVRDEVDAAVGRVKAVHNFGGGDILELEQAGRPSVMIPFSNAAVPVVDIDNGLSRIDTVAAGLVDDEHDEGRPPKTQRGKPSMRPRGPKEAGGNR